MRLFALMLLAILLTLASGVAAQTARPVRVGAAAVELEADDSMVIGGGILPGKATGQEGKLRATAVVIEKPGGGKVALVACDVLMMARDLLDPAA
jgi:neutral ceramidase